MRSIAVVAHVVALPTVLFFGPAQAQSPPGSDKAAYHEIARQEASKLGLPVDIADAVIAIESGYDPSRIGGVGEIGLMQIRPTTAAMLGFSGTPAELAQPATNIRLGVAYLAQAWRRAHGDLCRALMKYRAGHGEDVMTPLSVTYCDRARAHLTSIGSPYASSGTPAESFRSVFNDAGAGTHGSRSRRVLHGPGFWAAQESRVRAISARIERHWRVMAAR